LTEDARKKLEETLRIIIEELARKEDHSMNRKRNGRVRIRKIMGLMSRKEAKRGERSKKKEEIKINRTVTLSSLKGASGTQMRMTSTAQAAV